MTSDDQKNHVERTAATMHRTAERLEVAEAILHRSADESPNDAITARLHALGDQVTAQAHDIDRRADRLTGESDQPHEPQTAAGRDQPPRFAGTDGERPGPEEMHSHSAQPS